MINKVNIKKTGIAAALLGALLLSGCRDDGLVMPGERDDYVIKEPSIVFDLDLTPFDDDGNGSGLSEEQFLDHGESWENYIDPSLLRVIFCDMDGYFLFEVDRRNIKIISKDNSWSSGSLAYRVIISQNELYPETGRAPGQNEAVRKAIEEDGFKVAVLANWPNFVEDRREYDPDSGDELLGAKDIPTNLNFEWVPSDQADKPDNAHISWLSHCIFDNVYGVSTKDGDNIIYPYEQLAYYPNNDHTKGQMGVSTTWVQYIYKNQQDAALAIRQGKEGARKGITFTYDCTGMKEWRKTGKIYGDDPKDDPEKFTYTDYSYDRFVDNENEYSLENIWRLWNFSGGHSCSYHSDCGESVKAYWEMRNRNVLIRELNKPENWNANGFTITNHSGDILIQSHNGGSKYVPYQQGNIESGYLMMPKVLSESDFEEIKTMGPNKTQSLVTQFKEGALHFKAYGEGTLRIRAKSLSEKEAEAGKKGKIAVITLAQGYNAGAEVVEYITERTADGIYSETTEDPYFVPLDCGQEFIVREEYGQGGEYILDPGDTPYTDVYIGAIDADVDLYEVEYMRARHIYLSARNAIMPSAENAIPMYGIQNFDPIPVEFLQNNQTFNLSDKNENVYLSELERARYNYKNIFLLRSVAKVEIRLKKSVFANNPPTHIMMRSMNRSARCEPMDVVNPTEWIWYGHDNVNTYLEKYVPGVSSIVNVDEGAGRDNFKGIADEMDNIMKYYEFKPLYESGNSNLDEYKKRSSWFYGFWDMSGDPSYYWDNPWKWNGKRNLYTDKETGIPYPRIFNARIDRSDFCRFHQVPEKDGYIRYIMYVPEKNISDADSKGRLSASPKVEHIELRFKDMNTAMNFDDNSHYRIYFTKYSDVNGERTAAAELLGAADRDGRNSSTTFYSLEKDINFLTKLQPIIRNCHYIFTVESINDKKIGVQFSICGAAKRSTFDGGFTIK